MGACASISFGAAINVLINNWFKDKKSLAFGIVFSSSGITGAIFSPICSKIIDALGWRVASWAMAGICALMTLPFIILVVKRVPEDKGAHAYEDSRNNTGKNKNAVIRKDVVIENEKLVLACCMIFNFIACWLSKYLGHLVTFSKSMGATLMIASFVSSCSMIGNVLSKVGLGMLADKKGYFKALCVGISLTGCSFLTFILAGSNTIILYLGGFLYGSASALCSVITASMVSYIFNRTNYEKNLGKVQAVGYLGSAVAFSAIGFSFDIFDSYYPSFILAILLCAIAILLGIITTRKVKEA